MKKQLFTDPIKKQIVKLAIPVMIQNLLHVLMFFTDTLMVGHCGPVSLAAVAICGPLIWSITSVFMAWSCAELACVARAYGENNIKRVNQFGLISFYLNLISGALISITALFFSKNIISLFHLEKNVAVLASSYLKIVGGGSVFILTSFSFVNYLRALKDTKTPMIIVTSFNVLNIILNYLLIFGKAGFPQLGIKGAAIATFISNTLSSITLGIFCCFISSKFKLNLFKFNLITKKESFVLLKISAPVLVEKIFFHTGFVIFNFILAMLPTISIAANRIALTAESFSFLIIEGFGVAGATLVGQSLGKKDIHLASSYINSTVKLSIFISLVFSFIFLIFPHPLASIFTKSATTITLAEKCIRISSIEQPFLGLCIVISQILNGAGDTKSPMIVSILGTFITRIILVYLVAIVAGGGLISIWYCTAFDWFVRMLFLLYFLKSGVWKKIKI